MIEKMTGCGVSIDGNRIVLEMTFESGNAITFSVNAFQAISLGAPITECGKLTLAHLGRQSTVTGKAAKA